MQSVPTEAKSIRSSGTGGRGGCEQHCVMMGTELCSSVRTICVLSFRFFLIYLHLYVCVCLSGCYMSVCPSGDRKGCWIPGAEVTSRSKLPEVSAGT